MKNKPAAKQFAAIKRSEAGARWAITFSPSKFYDARVATVNAAADLLGPNSKEHRATEAAGDAVGVSGADLFFYNDQNGSDTAV